MIAINLLFYFSTKSPSDSPSSQSTSFFIISTTSPITSCYNWTHATTPIRKPVHNWTPRHRIRTQVEVHFVKLAYLLKCLQTSASFRVGTSCWDQGLWAKVDVNLLKSRSAMLEFPAKKLSKIGLPSATFIQQIPLTWKHYPLQYPVPLPVKIRSFYIQMNRSLSARLTINWLCICFVQPINCSSTSFVHFAHIERNFKRHLNPQAPAKDLLPYHGAWKDIDIKFHPWVCYLPQAETLALTPSSWTQFLFVDSRKTPWRLFLLPSN